MKFIINYIKKEDSVHTNEVLSILKFKEQDFQQVRTRILTKRI